MQCPDVHPSPPRPCRFTRRHRHGGGEGTISRRHPLLGILRAVAAAGVVLLLSCSKGDPLAGGSSETETGTASGRLVLKGGTAAQGARVTLYRAGEDSVQADSGNPAGGLATTTDASGAWAFDSLPFATYNMTAVHVPAGTRDTLVAARLSFDVSEESPDVTVGADTLRGPGAVSARVLFLGNPVEEAFCHVPGTSFLALTDADGRCLVSGIPPGRYRLAFKADGYLTARSPDSAAVATGDTVRLGDVELRLDESLPPPKPTGLAAAFDSSTLTVTLSWARVPAGDLAGYALYRDPVAAVSFTRLFPDRLVQDTSFVDSLAGMRPGADTLLAYRIRAQDRSGDQSGFALFDTVRVRMPRLYRAPAVPSAPQPQDASAGAPMTLTLRWQSGDADGDSLLADVYLDTLNPPQARIARSVRDSFLVVPALDSFVTYYWRVAVTDGWDTVPGPVWSFRTDARPGEPWQQLGRGPFQPMDVWFADTLRGWIVGPFGDITHTSDGGLTWAPQISGDTNWLSAIQFTDSLNGWVAGQNGTILKTRDGGTRWTKVPGSDSAMYWDLFFLDELRGWVAGFRSEAGQVYSVVRKTEDGGVTWTDQTVGNAQIVKHIQFLDAQVGYAFASRSPQTFVYKTVDGGRNWNPSDSIGIVHPHALHFINADTGWVGGATREYDTNLVARTVDGGRTWTLSRIPSDGGLNSFAFADGKTGWAAAGGVFRTSDGGVTWQREDAGGDRPAFISYFNLDRENGWAAGMDGAVYKRPPLPDP